MTTMPVIPCPVCGRHGGLLALSGPCLACTRARHRAAFTSRCRCGIQRQPRLVETKNRTWVTCDRCLGTIRHIK